MLTPGAGAPARRAGVVGSPIAHSLSPRLHRAAYAALGLTSWTFTAEEVPAGALHRYVEQLAPAWVGLAVTMPLKEEALALAGTASEAAVLAGAANTLLRREGGWHADNTDVHGVVRALGDAGLREPRHATVLGGGATARSTLVALHGLGVREVSFVVREDLRPETRELVERLGVAARVLPLQGRPLDLDATETDVVVSTLPATADPGTVRVPTGVAPPAVVMDVAYAPWPSLFAQAVQEASAGHLPVLRGTDMLLHQAVRQVELMTGQNGPLAAMRAALETQGTETA